MVAGGRMSRQLNYVKFNDGFNDGRFNTRYEKLLIEKFNAFVNGKPFVEEPPNHRVFTSSKISHLNNVEKLRDALHMYAYDCQKAVRKDHAKNLRFYDFILKAAIVTGTGAVFGAFGNLSPQLLAICAVASVWSIFSAAYSELLLDDGIKKFKTLANQVNIIYLQWKQKTNDAET